MGYLSTQLFLADNTALRDDSSYHYQKEKHHVVLLEFLEIWVFKGNTHQEGGHGHLHGQDGVDFLLKVFLI